MDSGCVYDIASVLIGSEKVSWFVYVIIGTRVW